MDVAEPPEANILTKEQILLLSNALTNAKLLVQNYVKILNMAAQILATSADSGLDNAKIVPI